MNQSQSSTGIEPASPSIYTDIKSTELKKIALIFAAASGLLPFIALLTWIFDKWQMTAFGQKYIPMAPSTALLMILISLAVILQNVSPAKPATKNFSIFTVICTAVMPIMILWQYFSGVELPVEKWLSSTSETIDNIPVGRMSPLTATVFLLNAISFMSELPQLKKFPSLYRMAPLPALSALVICSAVLLSYAADAPLLYGGKTVPMAILTAICFIFSGLSILVSSGGSAWLFPILEAELATYVSPKARSFIKSPFGILLFVSLSIGILGAVLLRNEIAESRNRVNQELSTIADLKVAQIVHWKKERLDDAEVILNTPAIQTQLLDFLENPSGDQGRQELLEWMRILKKAAEYHQIVLYDSKGMPILWALPDTRPPAATEEKGIYEAMQSKKIMFNELHFQKTDIRDKEPSIFIDMLIPIGVKPGTEDPPKGMLVLWIDPHKFLYPLMQSWPVNSDTAEILVVRKEGGEVTFLNELRHLHNTALTLKLPMRPDLPAAMAVMGKRGIVEGIDYRNEPVLAALNDIPGTPWFMVSKIDHKEIFGPLAAKAWIGISLILILVLIAALGLFLLEKQRDMEFYKDALEKAQERKKMQDALTESEQHLRNIFNQAAVGMCYSDLEGRFLKVNGRLCEITGYCEEEITSLTFREITHPDDLERDIAKKEELVTGAVQTYSLEKRYIQKKGGEIWVNATVSLQRSSDGKPEYFIGVIEDITERKLAENAVLAEKERLIVTLRSIGDAVITTDVNARITLMNKIAEKLTGWRLKDAMGRPLEEVFNIVNERTRIACENPAKKILRTGEIIEIENNTLLISRDGAERIIEDSCAPICDRGSVIMGVVLVFRDMTEKHKTERALQSALKLESLSILAGGIAHDFNNLLGGVFGYLDIALEFAEEGNAEAVKTSIGSALGVFERAKDLTMQLLTFSKGGSPMRKTESISKLVRDYVMFALSGSNVSAVFEIPDDIWLSYFDKNQMGQVIDNITINARQAMPLGGRLKITISNIQKDKAPELLKPGNYVRISISDNGPGITRENLAHIFDPFFTTKQNGNGLGLATSYSIVKRHDGLIDVETEIDKGTTFHIYLPASSSKAETGLQKEPRPVHKGQGRILLMDDEEALVKMTSVMLNRLGYAVASASNGDQAIEIVKQGTLEGQRFVAAIFDLTVPGGRGGKDIVREILDIDPAIKIVASSGYSGDSVMSNPSAFGFTTCLVKPFRMTELAKVLEDLFLDA